MIDVYVGTSGFSYKEWKGSFYPEDLADAEMLHFYAEHLRTVEINNTFYRMPKVEMLEAWGAQVPAEFRFVLKASRRITHFNRLKDADDSVRYLYRNAAFLGDRLGAVLFQLPPDFRRDVPRLQSFLELLPAGQRAAFEFRHESWYDDAVYEALRSRDAALCVADVDEDGKAVPLVATATWGYLRLRREEYSPEDLHVWAERIRAQPWSQAFAFFKHELLGPQLAASLSFELLGEAASRPALRRPRPEITPAKKPAASPAAKAKRLSPKKRARDEGAA